MSINNLMLIFRQNQLQSKLWASLENSLEQMTEAFTSGTKIFTSFVISMFSNDSISNQ